MTDVFKVLTPAKNINGEHTHVSMEIPRVLGIFLQIKVKNFIMFMD